MTEHETELQLLRDLAATAKLLKEETLPKVNFSASFMGAEAFDALNNFYIALSRYENFKANSQ